MVSIFINLLLLLVIDIDNGDWLLGLDGFKSKYFTTFIEGEVSDK